MRAVSLVKVALFHYDTFKSKYPCITNYPAKVPEIVDKLPAASNPIPHKYFPFIPKVYSNAIPADLKSMA